jgi:hypothetical protein
MSMELHKQQQQQRPGEDHKLNHGKNSDSDRRIKKIHRDACQ